MWSDPTAPWEETPKSKRLLPEETALVLRLQSVHTERSRPMLLLLVAEPCAPGGTNSSVVASWISRHCSTVSALTASYPVHLFTAFRSCEGRPPPPPPPSLPSFFGTGSPRRTPPTPAIDTRPLFSALSAKMISVCTIDLSG